MTQQQAGFLLTQMVSGTWIGLLGSVLFIGVFGATVQAQWDTVDPALADAELADVCFVNKRIGWAVGDRGVIWHTKDAGKTWRLQRSNVSCRLNSVCFLDAQNGWAAGGLTQAFTHVSQGVVLRTRDGGESWNPIPRLLVPCLVGIKFFDTKRGTAFGRRSALYPSGIFTTDDGGRTWAPLAAETGAGWLAGDFMDVRTGAVASRYAGVAAVRGRSVEAAVVPETGLRELRGLRLSPPASGWLVGDGGLIFTTADSGATWTPPVGKLPGDVEPHFDFSAVAVSEAHCWIAGAPGTRVFHSADGGRSWQAFATGQSVPLRGITFVDDQNGWAVGALGIIIATHDGGKTWNPQRAGGSRAALLGIYGQPSDVPLELVAQLSAGDGYLGVVEIVTRQDLDAQAGVTDDLPERTHEALVEVGGCGAETAWSFPVRQSGLALPMDQILATLNRANAGQAIEQLEAYLVRRIRIWRPEVILTHDASPGGEDPLGHLINQLVLRAAEKAGDSASFPSLATAGLEPWRVKKIYGTLPLGEVGGTNLDTTRLDHRLGKSAADVTAPAHGFLWNQPVRVPRQLGFRLMVDRVPQERGQGEIFNGLTLLPGDGARRETREPSTESFDELRRMSQKRRNMERLIERSGEQPGMVFMGQLGDLIDGLEPASGARLLFVLADQYFHSGRWELAAEAYAALIEKYPDDPLAAAARVWRVKYYASSEAGWRERKQSTLTARQTTPQIPTELPTDIEPDAEFEASERPGPSADFVQHLAQRRKAAAQAGSELQRTQPALFADPALRFALATAQRNLGLGNEAEKFYTGLRRGRAQDAWWAAAKGEEWLVKRGANSPKSVWRVFVATEKPHLDGELSDPCWQQALPVMLTSALEDDEAWPARGMLAYDSQFLYIALECGKPQGGDYPATDAPRPRDSDLSREDRVDLLIDLDRDYATYYRLSVDSRGWTGEACWNDASWDPEWFVAARNENQLWTIEAAIPLTELTSEAPQKGQAWALGIQRTIPGLGFQSWTQPAGTKVLPEGFGYLMFQ